ncbi:hypothetical protein L7F22_064373 [Adiantum nelumboides]|nr:hypothetical protein [Adiantum nelumboides]
MDVIYLPMQQPLGVLPLSDERDGYINWLKGEFAAANAIIDSMCQHVRSIGNAEDYDDVFSCLNRRRHSWTPTLYMQHFFPVDDIVYSLKQVAHKKLQDCCSSSKTAQHTLCQGQCNNSHIKFSKGNATLPHCQQQRAEKSKESLTENVAAPSGNTIGETGDDKGPLYSLINVSAGVAESSLPSCDSTTTEPSSTTNVSDKNGQSKTMEQTSLLDCEGLDATRVLNLEVAIASKDEDSRHALIKRSLQFQCCELEDGQLINDGESGELCECVFSSKEADDLVKAISLLQEARSQGKLGCAHNSYEKSDNKPDVLQFGPKCSDGLKMSGHLCMPRFLHTMIKWLTSCGILSTKRRPDSCIISIFNEGDFEPPNTDQGAWERPLCVISLLGNCNIVFGHYMTTDQQGNCKGPFEVTLPVGSVFLLQEKFAGILQKAVPAAPSKRIIIAFGKAVSTSNARLCYTIAEVKTRNKQWGGTAAPNSCYPRFLKQARVAEGISMHQLPHITTNHLSEPPLPSIQPILPFPNPLGLATPCNADPTMLQGWSQAPFRLQSKTSSGTGVFLPCTELSSMPTWQSGLLVSVTAGIDLCRTGHAKRGEKHAKVKRKL